MSDSKLRFNALADVRLWTTATAVFIAVFVIYWLSAALSGRTQSSEYAYFDYLAKAFLYGRSYLVNPPSHRDLTFQNGNWYVPFPPLPSLLMLPWVAICGIEKVNTILFSVAMGAANVALIFLILHSMATRGWTRLRLSDNLWLTALFGIGSVHWYMTTLGSVWFISQICTVTFIALAAWITVANGSPILSGLALAAAMLARPHVALSYPLLIGIVVQQSRVKINRSNWQHLGKWLFLSFVPLVVAVVILLGYNWMRFGDLFDFGYLKQNVSQALVSDLHTYGQFNLRYVPRNLWAMWLAPPLWDEVRSRPVPNSQGMSLLLTTPALVYLLRARQRAPLVTGAWISFGLLLIPLATYYNTGWYQFGYRFSLDFMVPVMVLLAVVAERRVSWTMRGLILAGVIVNAWGLAWLGGKA